MKKEPVSPYKMNIPTALKERIEEAAASNQRSVSGEIIAALEEAFPPRSEFRWRDGERVLEILQNKSPLQYFRENRGLSQQDLAREANISVETIRFIEETGHAFSLDTITRIAKALDVPVDDLV